MCALIRGTVSTGCTRTMITVMLKARQGTASSIWHQTCEAAMKVNNHYIKCCSKLDNLNEVKLNPPVLLRGEDLMQLGVAAGPRFKELLDSARAAQLDGLIATKSEAVTWVKRNLN